MCSSCFKRNSSLRDGETKENTTYTHYTVLLVKQSLQLYVIHYTRTSGARGGEVIYVKPKAMGKVVLQMAYTYQL